MLTSILFFLLYVIVAVIVVELLFWILGLIFPTAMSPRIRGLLYALALIIVIILAIQRFGGGHL